MSIYTTAGFWKAAAERAIKTAAQTAIALIGTDQVGILALDWGQIGSVTATAVILSLLTSLVSTGAGGDGPSLTRAEQVTPTPAKKVAEPRSSDELVDATEDDYDADGEIGTSERPV